MYKYGWFFNPKSFEYLNFSDGAWKFQRFLSISNSSISGVCLILGALSAELARVTCPEPLTRPIRLTLCRGVIIIYGQVWLVLKYTFLVRKDYIWIAHPREDLHSSFGFKGELQRTKTPKVRVQNVSPEKKIFFRTIVNLRRASLLSGALWRCEKLT